MSTPMRQHSFASSRGLRSATRGLLAIVLALWTASAVSAQTLTQNQGPNLGTWVEGFIQLQLAASGGGGNGTYVWSLVPGTGSLPPGISLRTDVPSFFSANANAGLIGIATTPGNYSFTLRVSSGGQTADRAYTWRISGLTTKDNNLPDAFVGRSYSYQLTALGNAGPVTWAQNGALPAGLSLSSSGLITGIPTTAGFTGVNFSLFDGVDTTFHGRSLSIFAIDITTDGALPNATQGQDYSATITAVGGAGGYTFTACSGNTTACVPGTFIFPSGLSMDSNGVISGTVDPNAGTGKYSITITATDTNHVSYSKLMSIDVIGTPPSLPSLTPYGGLFDDCTLGSTCSVGMFVGGGAGAPFVWTATGLPPGMSIRSGSGVTSQYLTPGDGELWGVPTAFGTYNVQVTVTDVQGTSTSNTFPLHISPMQLTDFLQNGTINVPYSSKIRAIGGRLPYTVALKSGTVPAGLTFDPATFTLSGTPLENSQVNFSFDPVFVFTDADGNTLERHSYFSIAANSGSTIQINTGSNLGTRTLNAFFSQAFSACCLPSYSWAVIGGATPPGVTLSADGILSGTPTAEGTFTFLAQVFDPTNGANVARRQFTLAITSFNPATVNGNLPFGNVGTPYIMPLGPTVSGLTWVFTPRTFPPPGFVLDSVNGNLHGTPQATGQYSFSVDISDGTPGHVVTRFFNIAIYAAGANPPLNLPFGPSFGGLLLGNFTNQLSATGGVPPYHYSLTPGATPVPGMRVQDGQPLPTFFTSPAGFIGVLTDSGVFHTSIRVTDSAGAHFDKAITMTVSPLAIVSQGTWPRGAVGTPYSFSLIPFGGTGPYSYTMSGFQPLPPGLSLNSVTGQISGTPTTTGTFFPTITLTDLATSTSVSQGFSVSIDPFNITPGVLPVGVVGTFYSQSFSAPGCGSPCTITTNANLGGLTMSGGIFSGTPTGTTNTAFTVTATGSGGTVSRLFSLEIVATTTQPLAISNTSVGPTSVGSTVTTTLTAFGGTPPYSWSIQSGTLPPGITLQSPGELIAANLNPGFSYLAGRAMAPGDSTFTLAVTDAANITATRTLTWHVTRLNFSYFNLPIVNTTLINNPLVYNTPYSQPLLTLGGTGSYTWALNTPLPPGLSLNTATGVVSGTPTNTGSVTTSFQVTDTAGNTGTNFITFNVSGPTATTLGFSSGPSLGTPQQGFSTSFNVTPIGGTAPYTVTPLTPLPPGFAILSGDSLVASGAAGSFVFSGMPLAPGPFSFTLQATDAVGNIGVRTFTFTVLPYTVFQTTLHDGTVGVPYSQQVIAWNGGGLTWTPSLTSPLPAGLSISSSGAISGTPQSSGTFSFSAVATDAATGTALTSFFSLRISKLGIGDPSVLSQVAIFGQPFTYPFTGSGTGTGVWSATGLPAGLTMSATGTISGTPNAVGTFNVLVTVTDGVVPIVQRFTLFSRLPNPTELDFSIANATLADVTVGQSTSLTLNPSGGVPPYTWAVAPGSSLPAGIRLLVADLNLPNFLQGATVLAGTPTTAGSYTFDLILTDSAVPALSVRRTFTLNVSSIGIVNGTPRSPVTGTAYAEKFMAVGGTSPYTFTISPTSLAGPVLPTGLSLSSDGLISGTATSTGSYSFLLKAVDSANHSFARTYTLNVTSPSGLLITGNNPPDNWVGGNRSLVASTNGSSTYNWSIVGGSLPPGVSLLSSGTLSGAPTVAGTYTFSVRAVDANNSAISADRTVTYRVSPIQPVSPPVEIFNVIALTAGQVNAPYSFTFKVAGGTPPYSITQSPFIPLPPGLTFNGLTLSGIPQAVGSFTIQPIISDSAGHVVNGSTHNLTVTPAGVASPLVRQGATTFPDASVGVPFIQPMVETGFTIRGGTAPFTWTLGAGSTLPPGLTLLNGGNGLSNLLGGVPTAAGSYAFSLIVSDAGGQSLTIPFTQRVTPLALTPGSLASGVVGTPFSQSLVPSGGLGPYTFVLSPASGMVPGLTFSASGQLAGTPSAPGNFDIFGTVVDSNGQFLTFEYFVTVDDALGEAPALSVTPKPIQVYYTTGSPAPAPVSVAINTTSGNLSFKAIVTGIPGATLSTGAGTTSSTVLLNTNAAALPIGVYNGVVAAAAAGSANVFDAVPVTVTVTAPPPCTYTLNPQSATIPATGGPGTFSVAAGPGCNWTTNGPPPSIATITAGSSGSGPGTVNYTVVPNPGTGARQLTFTVAGVQHVVTQFGSACSFAINPSKLTVGPAGGQAQITVTPSLASCTWTASGLSASPAGGTGSGIVTVTIPPNTGISTVSLTATIATKTLNITESGAACSVGLSPNSASATSAGGQGSVGIATLDGCAYDTTSAPSWVSVTSGGSGSTSGTLVYNVTPNSTTVQRIGTLTIGGQPFQITQDGVACSVTLDTSRLGSPFGSTGSTGLIGITTNGANCAWTASSDSPWAQLNTAGGTGSSTIGVTIQSNAASVTPRNAVLTINGQNITLQQSGTQCNYNLQSSTGSVPASGGAGSVGVVSPAVCTWTATSSDPSWLGITSGPGGTGTSEVQFLAQPNTQAAARSATLTIAGLTYTVTEAPAACTYSLSSTNVTIASSGASGSFTFSTAATGCTPAPVSYASWITATPSFNGVSGSVAFVVDPNPGTLSRVGTIRVGEQNFTVTETGGACGFSLNSYSALIGPLGDTTRSVFGSPSALGCSPAPVGTNQPSFITLGSLLGPTNNIFTQPYTVSPFNSITPALRFGNITFGGQIFVVKQTSY